MKGEGEGEGEGGGGNTRHHPPTQQRRHQRAISSLPLRAVLLALFHLACALNAGSRSVPTAKFGVLSLRRDVALVAAHAPVVVGLRLRGGLWYSPEDEAPDDEEWGDEDDESYYDTTEDDDAFEQGGAGGILSQMGRRAFVLPDGRRVDVDEANLPERLGEGLTLEQVRDHELMPVGTFCNGRYADIADHFLRHMRRRWVDGTVPLEDTVPLRLYDVYGLHRYVKTADEDNAERGRVFLEARDNKNDPRNLLKVPAADLPDFFHMPCGGDPDGVTNYMTLAKRFGNWTGPAPQDFSGYVRTPKGRIGIFSYDEPTFDDDEDTLLNATDDFRLPLIPSREALAFFQDATRRNLENGNAQVDQLDGTYEPGPVCWAEDVTCSLSGYSLGHVQAQRRSALRDQVVPWHDKPLLYEAIQMAEHGI